MAGSCLGTPTRPQRFRTDPTTLRLVGARYSVTSCDLRILMDQPTESISPHDPPSRRDDRWLAPPERRQLPQGAVRTMHVVMVGILGQHQPQLPASHDEQPVQHLAPNRADPPIRIGIRPRRRTGVVSTSIAPAAKTASNGVAASPDKDEVDRVLGQHRPPGPGPRWPAPRRSPGRPARPPRTARRPPPPRPGRTAGPPAAASAVGGAGRRTGQAPR
jgi:hypothetical protein